MIVLLLDFLLLVPLLLHDALSKFFVQFLKLLLGMILLLLLKILEEGFFVGLLEGHGVFRVDEDGVLLVELLMGLVVHDDRVDAALLVVGEQELILDCVFRWIGPIEAWTHILLIIVVEIAVFHKFFPTHSLVRIVLKTIVQEVEALQTQLKVLGKPVVTLLKVSLEVVLVHASEWRKACEHLVKDRAKTPHVYLWTVFSSFQNLRSHVEGSTTHGLG